jgi:hypothetical protein
MIEDELRSLLADRAGSVPANPTRTAQVHARVRTTRRRRTAGTALGLVLLALAGLALARLPGHPDAAPSYSVPPGPWLTADGGVNLPGYVVQSRQASQGDPVEATLTAGRVPVRLLVLVRCDRPGDLVVRNTGPDGPVYRLACSVPGRRGSEGMLELGPDEAARLLALSRAATTVRFEPGSAGRWDLLLLKAVGPDRLGPAEVPVLLEGANHPEGGTVTTTLPAGGLELAAECVRGVRLTLTVPGGTLAEIVCDENHRMTEGRADQPVPAATVDRLGLRPGQQVELTVRSTGLRTGQWRLLGFLR